MDHHSDMAIYVKVVATGGFSAAARDLKMTHSAISKRVKRLEERLKTQLIIRTTRGMTLTEAGEQYFHEAKRIIENIESLEDAVVNSSGTPRGQLRVSVSNAFGRQQIVPAVVDFMKLFPDVAVDLTLTDRVVDLKEERVDVAVRSGVLNDSGLIARKLASNDRIICASPAYLMQYARPAQPQDLANHVCLKLNFPSKFDEWEFRGTKNRKMKPGGSFVCNSVEALHMACLAGIGIARLPEFLLGADLSSGRLISLLDDVRLPTGSNIYAVRPAGTIVPAKSRAFIDFLVARFMPRPPWYVGEG
ncbi:LysR family transcriptional regulator [Nguyenibacter vanlangensis]|uniref:LysR family transcriptional regulator n=1 Tax=Nguyenibacter vanlangensis TaxID=1216886 RepID=A0ABZ3D8W1_9PROT